MNDWESRDIFNWSLLATVLLIAVIGFVNLTSAASDTARNLPLLQGMWVGVGTLFAFVLWRVDYHVFERFAYVLFVFALLLLLAVLIVGREVSGSKRWIYLGGFNFQPSELMKLAVILALAKYFSDDDNVPARGYTLRDLIKLQTPLYPVGAFGALLLFWEREPLLSLDKWRFVLLGVCLLWAAASVLFVARKGNTSWHNLLSPVILIILPVILIVRQPDLGTSLVLLAIAGTMILFAKVRMRSFLIAVGVSGIACIGAWFLLLKDYQKERILAFLYPEADILGSGYHALQSFIAVGSGQLTGKGIGQSTQTQFHFLPEQHTDFVFSVWAEETGFVGALIIISLFFALLVQIINVGSNAKDKFGILVAVGICALIFWQVFINIGMVIGILPVVGITLPLWSYGGSSVLATMTGVGLVMSIARRKNVY